MSSFVINESEYQKFCDELYFLTNRITWFEDVKILYYLNQSAYNYRYKEKSKIYKLYWNPQKKLHYQEKRIDKIDRMLYFLQSVNYQICESDKLYKKSCRIIGELTLVILQTKTEHPNIWGEY